MRGNRGLALASALLVVSAAGICVGAIDAGATASAPGWSIVPAPTPSGAPDGASFTAVSCTLGDACTAVGCRMTARVSVPCANVTRGEQVLAERWNGSTWTIEHVPAPPGAGNATLTGVSCPALRWCVAVGGYRTATGTRPLAEGWNGATWARMRVAGPGSAAAQFDAVSCPTATNCTAVGSPRLAERWTGARFALTPVPGRADTIFQGVSCSSATICTAVGQAPDLTCKTSGCGTPFAVAARFDGTSWSRQQLGDSALAVSCGSSTSCMAIDDQTFGIEQWRSSGWRTGPTTNIALGAVSCVSATDCTAAGTGPSFNGIGFETWNGAHWSKHQAHALSPGRKYNAPTVDGISCAVSGVCTIVGSYSLGPGPYVPLVEAGP